MPLWSLTQERVDKLLRQIGDKEEEIDELIKLSKEEIWNRDLDAFIQEWHDQLKEERDRKRRVNNMGRRASSKLKLGAKAPALVKKRKALGDDPDDEDFGAPKPKKVVNEAKRPTITVPHKPKAGILNYLHSPKGKTLSKTNRNMDGASSDLEMDVDDEELPAKPAEVKSKAASKELDLSEAEDDSRAPAPRQARAARKPIKYAALSDSDSENGDDLLGDVSNMVKGIGAVSGETKSDNRTLFSSSTSRPTSSAGLKTTSKILKPATNLSADDTDYSKLVPQQSPRRSLLVTAKDTRMSDDDDEEDDFDLLSVNKPKPKPAAKPNAPSSKPPKAAKAPAKAATKSSAGTSKGGRGRRKKDAAREGSVQATGPAKSLQLSPAAKAYAAKQAKANKKKLEDSDDDMDAMADDILNSDDSINENSPPPRKAPARPARRAATTKAAPRYVIDDDDSDEDAGAAGNDSSAMFSEDDD